MRLVQFPELPVKQAPALEAMRTEPEATTLSNVYRYKKEFPMSERMLRIQLTK